MAGISDSIERFIKELLIQTDTRSIEIQRNEMAEHFQCSPSQINYVLSTRFTPYQGYYIESKRGGGGYIRIEEVRVKDDEKFTDMIVNIIGEEITKSKAHDIVEGLLSQGIINDRESKIIKASLGDGAFNNIREDENKIRADMLINILLILSNLEGL